MNNLIDVIIPVYRGLQDVIDCLDSVKSSFNQSEYELIVIDDCSPDPAVSALLQERFNQGEFTLLVNQENLGFVATVNRGMQLHPERDVLLLNSDTLVVNDWLDRIANAAYAAPNVATVTPFSNNATICSYPKFCQDNNLPYNTSLKTLDALCAATNAGDAVDVPTGVGFCMYIRRAILDKIGYFDVETFGKGYGEENDFCQRAIQAGWVNRFALDVFVQHTGNVSFGDEHNELKHTALAKLLEHHPHYEHEVQQHVAQDPAHQARIKIWLASLTQGELPIVVHVTHNRGGGTLRFINELSEDIRTQCLPLMLMPSIKKPGQLVLTQLTPSEDGLSSEESDYSLYIAEAETLLTILKYIPVAGFHFHHMLDIPHWVMFVPKQMMLPWLVSLHDYYYICDSISLTNEAGEFSQAEQLNIDESWTQPFSSLLQEAKACIAPSDSCKAFYQQAFPSANLVTIYHEQGRYLKHDQFKVSGIEPKRNQPLHVVVIGALGKIKGADLLEESALLCAQNNVDIQFNLIGYAYRDLVTTPKSTLTVSGRYSDHELLDRLTSLKQAGKVDVIWFTSRCPETYSYTLSSAIEAGLPIIAPNIGAFPERLFGRCNSWVIPWDADAEFVVKQLADLAAYGDSSPALSNFTSKTAPSNSYNAYQYSTDYWSLLEQKAGFKQSPNINQIQLKEWLAAALPYTCDMPSADQAVRRRLLTTLYYLRGLPVLRQIVKRIPLSFQRRVRNFFAK